MFPQTGLGKSYNFLTHKAARQLIWQPFRSLFNQWRREVLDLPSLSFLGPSRRNPSTKLSCDARVQPVDCAKAARLEKPFVRNRILVFRPTASLATTGGFIAIPVGRQTTGLHWFWKHERARSERTNANSFNAL